jgi:outer membrane protein TolC
MSLLPLDTDAQAYSLNEVIEYSQNYSPEAMKNSTSKENKYWQWRTYKSNYKPQLVLNTTLPSFQNNNIGVLQGDGSIIYRNINQSQSQISLSLEQNISLTGGKLFLRSDLSRFDNFNNKTNSYSGSPFFIGIEQPLFSFNTLKWMNRVEPLKYEESLKEYIEDLENIAFTTTHRYFYLLIAQINYGIAEINLNNATSLYNLGKEKFKMGKISKNELLQLKYGFVSSQKSISNADLYRESAQLSLSSYTGIKNIGSSPLSLPVNISTFLINDSVAIEKANEHSKRSIEFKRYIVEAQQELERAKRESSLNANLIMSYGTTNVSGNIPNIYDNTQSMKSLNFGLTVPILDWGRAKAIRKTAGANLKLAEYTVDQEKINFSDEIIKEIKRFRMLLNLIDYTKEADNTAAERFEIARLRYIAEDISLTEYNIALEEKDRAKQDYIIALRDYWLTFYTIRILTLYDFQNKRQI